MTNEQAILTGLSRLYPAAKPELNFSNPYETMVATILSAQCTDKRVNEVTPAVFRDFPTVQAMAETTPEKLFPYVKSCGFSQKASNIVMACRKIMTDFGGQVPRTMEELVTLPGVGRKTANVILAFAFGQPAMPVDTHVFRVSNRLGLCHAANVLDTEKQLCELIPREEWSQAHHWLIYHGRRVCHARRPDCENCTLRDHCRAYQSGETQK